MPSETTEFVPLLTRADHWEFPRVRLRLSTILGSGAFGMVMRGDAQGIRGSSGSVKVAVKIAKGAKLLLYEQKCCLFVCLPVCLFVCLSVLRLFGCFFCVSLSFLLYLLNPG